jgi:hypothetical protein
MVDLGDARTDGVKLGLKLYHAREFQLDSQQLAAEAPAWPDSTVDSILGERVQHFEEGQDGYVLNAKIHLDV